VVSHGGSRVWHGLVGTEGWGGSSREGRGRGAGSIGKEEMWCSEGEGRNARTDGRPVQGGTWSPLQRWSSGDDESMDSCSGVVLHGGSSGVARRGHGGVGWKQRGGSGRDVVSGQLKRGVGGAGHWVWRQMCWAGNPILLIFDSPNGGHHI
jgi:hypothetical protein